MKKILVAIALAVVMQPLLSTPGKADGYHDHWHGGVYIGGYAPYPYYPYGGVQPYAYPAPPVIPYAVAPVILAPPPGIVGPPASIAYYCSDPSGYYPYVSTCFRHWHAIPVQ